jgi:hypothetical protein
VDAAGGLACRGGGDVAPVGRNVRRVEVVELADQADGLVARVENFPGQGDEELVVGVGRGGDGAGDEEVGVLRVGGDVVAEFGQVLGEVAGQREVAVAGGAGDAGDEKSGRAVFEGIGVGALDAGVDGVEEVFEGRGVLGGLQVLGGTGLAPGGGVGRGAGDVAVGFLVGADQGVVRDDAVAGEGGGGDEAPLRRLCGPGDGGDAFGGQRGGEVLRVVLRGIAEQGGVGGGGGGGFWAGGGPVWRVFPRRGRGCRKMVPVVCRRR